MRNLGNTLTALAALALATPAGAYPAQIDIGWNACAPTTTNLPSIAPGTTGVSLWVTALGIDRPHKAYQFEILYADMATRDVPDAWRFDLNGCQGQGYVSLDHHSYTKACPPLTGAITSSLQIKTLSRNGSSIPSYDPDLMHIGFANAYPNGGAGNTTQVDPAVRYFLGRIVFNHVDSVEGPSDPGITCGGLESSICFVLVRGSYVTLEGALVELWGSGNRSVTVGTSPGCPYTPARNVTWGWLKALVVRR